jgi:catechol 2,3-dioxygenase-like lactoylglutathione lyase family enzyme
MATLTTRATTQAISPFFIVTEVDRTIAFYCGKLGFKTRFREPEQNPFFAIVGRDGAQLFVKAHQGIAPLPNCKRHPWMKWDAFVYVEEPDAPRNLPIAAWRSASRFRIRAPACAGSRFRILTGMFCSSDGQDRARRRPTLWTTAVQASRP